AGDVEVQRRAIETAQRDAMPGVSVERAGAGAADRIVRIDALIADRAKVRLMTSIRDTEFVRAGEDVARRVRQRVEALQLEAVAEARMAADVEAVVFREAVAHPHAEASECREATAAGGRATANVRSGRIARIRTE